jgi:hypothetical protein
MLHRTIFPLGCDCKLDFSPVPKSNGEPFLQKAIFPCPSKKNIIFYFQMQMVKVNNIAHSLLKKSQRKFNKAKLYEIIKNKIIKVI